jgi:hypothetical protein
MKANVIRITAIKNEKLDLETCRKILNAGNRKHSDEEVLRIRDYLYRLATIECWFYDQWINEQTETPIINLQDETEKSTPIHPGKYRRTG